MACLIHAPGLFESPFWTFQYRGLTVPLVIQESEASSETKPASVPGMSRKGRFVVTIAVFWCVATTVLAAHRTTLFILILPLTLVFLGAGVLSLFCVLAEWEDRRWRSLLPLMVFVAAIFVSGIMTQLARKIIFSWAFPSYEKVVQRMESGEITVSRDFEKVPAAEPAARLAYRVLAGKDADGVLTVEFFTERSFPARHSGYLYRSSGVSESDPASHPRWPVARKVKDKWLYVSE